jgi:hypothetical protein
MKLVRRTLIFPISVPPISLRSNGSRGNQFVAREARRKQREEARKVAQVVLDGKTPPLWKEATYKIVAHTQAQWDDDNVISSLKGARDGLADACIVSNDRNLRITGVEWRRACGMPRIELHVTGEGAL